MRFFLPVLIVVSVSLGGVNRASGQDTEGANYQRALSLGHEALQHFARGEFDTARDKFERADSLAHSPVFRLYQARSERKLNHLIRAKEILEECVQEPITPSTPDAWRKAIIDAVAELEQLSESIPRVRLVISGEPALPIVLEGNGRAVSLTEPETTHLFDPGAHRLSARDASGTRLQVEVHLSAGETPRVIQLRFPRVRRGDGVAEPPPSQALEPDRKAPAKPYRSAAHAAFFLGGSAFLFSAVATTVAVVKASEVKRHCVSGTCRPEDQTKAQAALRWANLATAGVVVGATGVVSGIGLLVLPGDDGGGVVVSGKF